jgi:hypothetical protein
MTPNFVAGGAATSVERSVRPVLDGDDHLVGGIEAVSVADHVVGRSRRRERRSCSSALPADRLREFGAQRVALSWQALSAAPVLGDPRRIPDQPFRRSVARRNASAQHGEPHRAHRRGKFDVGVEVLLRRFRR